MIRKGSKLTQEHRKKLSLSHIGLKYPPFTKERKTAISLKNKERYIKNPDLKKQISLKLIGKKKSIETRKRMSDRMKLMTGSKSIFWRGGRMKDYSENDRVRKSLEYVLWRKSIFERDNFTCQKYGIRGGILHAHHINNFADFPELRLALDNGITLSEKAHKEFHKKYGRSHNTREQMIEFLK